VEAVHQNALDTLYACDFFSVETLGPFGVVRYMVFFVIELKSRTVEIAGIAVDPCEEWMKQVARNLTDPVEGFLRGAKVFDPRSRSIVHGWVRGDLKAAGVKSVKIPAHSPNCNPYAERFGRTIKYECLNQYVIFGERHLRHLVEEFVEHYHTERFSSGARGPTDQGPAWLRERQRDNWPNCLSLTPRGPPELLFSQGRVTPEDVFPWSIVFDSSCQNSANSRQTHGDEFPDTTGFPPRCTRPGLRRTKRSGVARYDWSP